MPVFGDKTSSNAVAWAVGPKGPRCLPTRPPKATGLASKLAWRRQSSKLSDGYARTGRLVMTAASGCSLGVPT